MHIILQALLLLILLSLSALFLFLHRRFNYWKRRGVPTDKPNFLIGNLTFLLTTSTSDYFKKLAKKVPSDYVGMYLGWKPAIVVQTSELARQVLTKDFHNFQNRMTSSSPKSDPMGALNLFAVNNPTWSSMRQELTPMFTSARLKMLADLMNINATQLVNKIKRDHIDGNLPVNLKDLFSMYTSDTVGYSVFGIQVSALNDPSNPLWFITKHMVRWTFWRGLEFHLLFFLPAVSSLLRLKLFSKPATDHIKKLFWDVVNERKSTGKSSDKDLVNHLLKLKDNLKLPAGSSEELAENLMLAQAAVFILGSIETSSTTLSYSLHELAHHPEEQEKLYEEIRTAIVNKGKDILEYNDLLELKYLNAVMLETLRKHNPVPYLERVCINDYKLTDDVTIEAGTPTLINVEALHRNPNYFPEPDKWRPERLMGVPETDNLQFNLLPFGDGPRFCIGRRYGTLQVRAALAQVIYKYKILPDPTEPYDIKSSPYSLFLSPTSGARVKFEER